MNTYNDYSKNIISSVIASSILYPIDYIKTIIQNNNNKISIYKHFSDLVKKRELHLIYKGNTPFIYGNILAIEITLYNYLQKQLKNNYYSDIIIGSIVGSTTVLLINPIEVIKIHYQTNINTKIKRYDLIKKIGTKNLFKGSSLCLLRDVPWSILYYGAYNNINNFMLNNNKYKISNSMIPLYSSIFASIPATTIVTPIDVIKTRYQILDNKYTSLYDCILDLYKNQGVKGFFKGNAMRIYKNASIYGLTFYFINKFDNLKIS